MYKSLISLLVTVSICVSASETEQDTVFLNVQVGGKATLDCGAPADKWTFTRNESTEIIDEGKKSNPECWLSVTEV